MTAHEDKSTINRRVQDRYDELGRQGAHGHYETMFQIVHEELARAAASSEPWRPMITVPLDGSDVLLYIITHGVTQARFYKGGRSDARPGRMNNGPMWVCGDDAWYIDVKYTEEGYDHGDVIAWKPLTAPPGWAPSMNAAADQADTPAYKAGAAAERAAIVALGKRIENQLGTLSTNGILAIRAFVAAIERGEHAPVCH